MRSIEKEQEENKRDIYSFLTQWYKLPLFASIAFGLLSSLILKQNDNIKLSYEIIIPILYTVSTFLILGAFSEGLKFFKKIYNICEKSHQKVHENSVKCNTSVLESINDRHDLIFNKINERLDSVDGNLNSIVEYAALHTEHKKFERAIEHLRSTEGKKRWIIAKFISEQLNKAFSSLEFEIDSEEYSHKTAREFYSECENSIYLTSPFTPFEWFRYTFSIRNSDVSKNAKIYKRIINYINNENAGDPETKGLNLLNKIKDEFPNVKTPEHLKTLLNMSMKRKDIKRLVVLNCNDWSTLLNQQDALEAFHILNDNINIRYVLLNDLASLSTEMEEVVKGNNNDFTIYDYAVFDKSIILKWQRPLIENAETPLRLIYGSENEIIRRTINKLFDFDYNREWKLEDIYCDFDKVFNKIEESKREIIKEARGGKINHKHAYYGIGSIIWNEISSSNNYKLGLKEERTFNYFIQQTEKMLSGPVNIFHIGPGDGKEIHYVLNKYNRIINYYLIDISADLLNIAHSKGEKYRKDNNLHNEMVFKKYVCDITKNILKIEINNRYPSLFLIIGNGAILSNKDVLTNIWKMMRNNDRLIITLETNTGKDNAEKIFEEEYSLDSIIKLFSLPLELIGIRGRDIYNKEFYEAKLKDYEKLGGHLFEVHFNYKSWIEKNRQGDDDIESSNYPDKIRVFASYKPLIQDLKDRLSNSGLEIIEEYINYDDTNCSAFLCSKK